jgi:hypothetical protein
MSLTNVKKDLKLKRQRNYLSKDFDSIRSDLIEYAKVYFPDKIQDFSEASVGGMLLDFTAFVGDLTAFYLDHQFNELGLDTAVERRNVERLIRLSGVKIRGASPAYCDVDFTFTVDAELTQAGYQPKTAQMLILRTGTRVLSNSGISFTLMRALDFSERDGFGRLVAKYSVASTDSNGNPSSFFVTRTGTCASGGVVEEQFNFGSDVTPFKTITLSNSNVSEILLVKDSDSNEYYEVESLSQDTVFKSIENFNNDAASVENALAVVPAPYRFTTRADADTGTVTIVFGSGRADTLDNDILPDPSEVSLPLFGDKKVFSRVSIDPNSLLGSKSLGITPVNTTVRVRYRFGGGISHNVSPNTIRTIANLDTKFSPSVLPAKSSAIRATIQINNPSAAQGGENAPTLEDLRSVALSVRNSQNRVVSKEDLIARIFLMPTNFGRAFRVGIQPNPVNPLSSLLFLVSRNSIGYLEKSPDTLKRNISTYINEFRVVSDSFDILDAKIVNIGFTYNVVIDDKEDKSGVITRINNALIEYLATTNMHIDGGIRVADLVNLIINQDGVLSLDSYKFTSLTGEIDDRDYSSISISPKRSIVRGVFNPPLGGIFEVKYPDVDIIGNSI